MTKLFFNLTDGKNGLQQEKRTKNLRHCAGHITLNLVQQLDYDPSFGQTCTNTEMLASMLAAPSNQDPQNAALKWFGCGAFVHVSLCLVIQVTVTRRELKL